MSENTNGSVLQADGNYLLSAEQLDQLAASRQPPAQPAPAAPAKPAAATAAEIKSHCQGSAKDPAFVLEQLEAGATLEQAGAAWMAKQQDRLEAAEAASKTPGVDQLGGGNPNRPGSATADAGDYDGDSRLEFNQHVEAKVKLGMNRMRAVSAVAKEYPHLREQMVAEANAARVERRRR